MNSIEEDIKILEELRIANENCIKNAKNKDNPFVAIWEKQNIAIEHILSDYKRVLKENEIYKKNSEIMSKENLSTAEQLKVEIKENFRLKNQLDLVDAKNIEKDKIIDLMAEQLGGLAIFDIDKDETLILGDKEEVKQYFKDKVKGKE